MTESVVVDASGLVDLLAGTSRAPAVRARLWDAAWHSPAHLDTEVLSALGRLHRGGTVTADDVEGRMALLAAMPVQRHLLPPLLTGAWGRRAELRLVDALYVELAARLQLPLITTDQRLGRATRLAEVVAPSRAG